jgi:hypothetical protein
MKPIWRTILLAESLQMIASAAPGLAGIPLQHHGRG